MSTAPIYEMKTSAGVQIPLVRTAISGLLRDTALETTVTQHYRNDEAETIEGVYTFPLPVGATLMNLEVDLNGEVLRGTVVEAKQAQEDYEDAIEDGNSALLLQKINDAMFTLNVGNLQPGDTAIVSIQYTQLLSWQQNTLRIMYPTTIGDRYGRPAALGMQHHQFTGEDPAVEHRVDFSLQVSGRLARCAVSCPSHALAISSVNDELLVSSTTAGLAMDRDIVICIERRDQLAGCSGYYDRDLNGQWVGWLSLNPIVTEELQERSITIVIDCSGSMRGISMQQAKIAVREIVEQLGRNDWFNIIMFGSTAHALFPDRVRARKKNKARALRTISGMDATLGGTKIGSALQLAYEGAKGPGPKSDLLLITDGQVCEVPDVENAAAKSGLRHFTVGVGTAVAQDLVTGLATKTGGACELISPNEDMADAIIRHVKRSYVPPLSGFRITWPVKTRSRSPEIVSHAFSGDTLHVFAQFDEQPRGEAAVRLTFDDQDWEQEITLLPYSESSQERELADLQLARLCAARRLKDGGDEEKTSIGIQYQLQTVKTSYVLVAEREDKDESVMGPALRQVPQMLKANDCFESIGRTRHLSVTLKRAAPYGRKRIVGRSDNDPNDYFEVPATLRRQSSESLGTQEVSYSRRKTLSQVPVGAPAPECRPAQEGTQTIHTPEAFVQNLNRHFSSGSVFRRPEFPSTLKELEKMGLDKRILQALDRVLTGVGSYSESTLIILFLDAFRRHPAADRLDKQARKAILRARKTVHSEAHMQDTIFRVMRAAGPLSDWRLTPR